MGRRRSTADLTNATAPLALEPSSETLTIPAPMPAPSATPTAWRVVKTARVSWWGAMTTLPAGKVVQLSTCGPEGLARLREQGVELEPMG